jgi:alkylhydroperoxidase family enzyme
MIVVDHGQARFRSVMSLVEEAGRVCGNIFLMKKTLHIDEKLLEEARAVSGAATDTETVRLGLEALVRHAAYDRLRVLRGSEPGAQNVPRRREKQPRKRWAS